MNVCANLIFFYCRSLLLHTGRLQKILECSQANLCGLKVIGISFSVYIFRYGLEINKKIELNKRKTLNYFVEVLPSQL